MRGEADIVFVDGKIFTAARRTPWAKALAIRGDRLVAVGTNAQASRWAGRRTRVIDLRGRLVVPGFIDAHAHMAEAAGESGWARLEGARTMDDALERLRRLAARTDAGAWVIGTGWDESKWPERQYLGREDLDRVSTSHPVLAIRIDAHMGSLNGLGIERAAGFAGLRGFEADGMGRPTGVLKEDAFGALYDTIEPSEAAVEAGLPGMARAAHRLGITSIHDVVDRRGLRAYQRAHRAGRLRLRVYAMPRDSLLASLVDAGVMTGLGDEWLRIGAIKVFSDGSLGAYTAALDAPYVGRPSDTGLLMHPPRELRSILETAHRAGFQTATHAIGDAAIRLVVETLSRILEEAPRKNARHRIEHYELPDEDALRATKATRLIASCQPNFVGQWSGPGDVYETRLGKDRASRNNPYRRILRHGIPLCFGSDGMPYGPLFGIHWAVNGFYPDQRIGPEAAFRAATVGGAFASFEEGLKGTLEAGKLADFVILDGDPFRDPERIRRIRVQSTWIGGRRVYAKRRNLDARAPP